MLSFSPTCEVASYGLGVRPENLKISVNVKLVEYLDVLTNRHDLSGLSFDEVPENCQDNQSPDNGRSQGEYHLPPFIR